MSFEGFLRPTPSKGKCIHVVAINNWYPELTAITLPLLRKWAFKIGADFNLIEKAKFLGWPPNYERMQIYEAGKDYLWNINIDADYVIDPETLEDPTKDRDFWCVYAVAIMHRDSYFKNNRFFFKDEPMAALPDSFLITSLLTHDLWKPLECSFEEAAAECIGYPEYPIHQNRQVSEFCINLNFAMYGYRWEASFGGDSRIYHIGATGNPTWSDFDPVKEAKKKLKEWGME